MNERDREFKKASKTLVTESRKLGVTLLLAPPFLSPQKERELGKGLTGKIEFIGQREKQYE